ncbi:phosphinothricin acetyltransferase [Burkholderiales bacterium]|nr:phosphinothricin acetyltransferase [Burkholderiales bacterium]
MSYDIVALTPKHQGDYLAYFDGPAFADNPDWAGCYCHFYFCPRQLDWKSLGSKENRDAIAARIAVGEMEGYLAYSGQEVVGWLNVQPRHRAPHAFMRLGIAPTPLDFPETDIAMVLCFVVHPEHRRRGVATALLEGALAELAARGFRCVEAYPFKADEEDLSEHYHGPRQLFEAAGFTLLRDDAKLCVLRKALRPCI